MKLLCWLLAFLFIMSSAFAFTTSEEALVENQCDFFNYSSSDCILWKDITDKGQAISDLEDQVEEVDSSFNDFKDDFEDFQEELDDNFTLVYKEIDKTSKYNDSEAIQDNTDRIAKLEKKVANLNGTTGTSSSTPSFLDIDKIIQQKLTIKAADKVSEQIDTLFDDETDLPIYSKEEVDKKIEEVTEKVDGLPKPQSIDPSQFVNKNLFVAAIVLLLGVCGFLYHQTHELKKELKKKGTPEPITEEEMMPYDETENRKSTRKNAKKELEESGE